MLYTDCQLQASRHPDCWEHRGAALTGLPPAADLVGGSPDVNRDIQANCPTIAMNAGEFGRANQSDEHVFWLQHQYRQESSYQSRG
jgi:hypothetical protein